MNPNECKYVQLILCTITCAEIYNQFLMSFSPLEYVIVTTSLCHCYPLSMSLCIIYAPFSQCPPTTHWALYFYTLPGMGKKD